MFYSKKRRSLVHRIKNLKSYKLKANRDLNFYMKLGTWDAEVEENP